MANPDGAQVASNSRLSLLSERDLLVKILAESRVQTLLMAQAFGSNDDIAALRDEVMSQGNDAPSSI